AGSRPWGRSTGCRSRGGWTTATCHGASSPLRYDAAGGASPRCSSSAWRQTAACRPRGRMSGATCPSTWVMCSRTSWPTRRTTAARSSCWPVSWGSACRWQRRAASGNGASALARRASDTRDPPTAIPNLLLWDPMTRSSITATPGPRGLDGVVAARTRLSHVDGLAVELADPDNISPSADLTAAKMLTARFPTLVAAHARIGEGREPIPPRPDLSRAANFLYMVHGKEPDPIAARALGTYWVTVIDHGMNASTFT